MRICYVLLVTTLLALPSIAKAHFEIRGTFPSYLFIDPVFYLFSLMNIAGIALAVSCIIAALKHVFPQRIKLTEHIKRPILYLFLVTLVYQVFHQIEHFAQMYQYKILGLPRLSSSGILWFFNIEWNHFIFNGGYFIGLAIVSYWLLKTLRAFDVRMKPHVILILCILALQGWHVIEHITRISRHITLTCEPCPGILDKLFGWQLITLHFWFNTIALILPLVIFIWYGFHERIIEEVKIRFRHILSYGE